MITKETGRLLKSADPRGFVLSALQATLAPPPAPIRTTQHCWWQNNPTEVFRGPANHGPCLQEAPRWISALMAAVWEFSDDFPECYAWCRLHEPMIHQPAPRETCIPGLTLTYPSTTLWAWDPFCRVWWLLRQGSRLQPNHVLTSPTDTSTHWEPWSSFTRANHPLSRDLLRTKCLAAVWGYINGQRGSPCPYEAYILTRTGISNLSTNDIWRC